MKTDFPLVFEGVKTVARTFTNLVFDTLHVYTTIRSGKAFAVIASRFIFSYLGWATIFLDKNLLVAITVHGWL